MHPDILDGFRMLILQLIQVYSLVTKISCFSMVAFERLL